MLLKEEEEDDREMGVKYREEMGVKYREERR